MNCRWARRRLTEYDLGALSPRQRERVAEHLHGCEACRSELAQLQSIASALGPMPQAAPPRDLWPVIESRLCTRRRLTRWLGNAWEPAVAVGAAALLVLVLMYGSVAPSVSLPDMSFDAARDASTADESVMAVNWQRPFADDAALGLELALAEAGGDEG